MNEDHFPSNTEIKNIIDNIETTDVKISENENLEVMSNENEQKSSGSEDNVALSHSMSNIRNQNHEGSGDNVAGNKTVIQNYKNKALGRLSESAEIHLNQLEKNYDQVRNESSRFFWMMLTSSSLGFIIIIFSIILLFLNKTTAAIVTTTASIIPNTTSLLFFKKENELRKSIKKYHDNLMESYQISLMVDIGETISNKTEQDYMKKLVILKILKLDKTIKSEKDLVEIAKMEEKIEKIIEEN